MKYISRLRQLLTGLVKTAKPSETDRVWLEWLNLTREREVRDLITLLHSDVRQEFKARAVTALLAPDLRLLPFRWNTDKRRSLHNFLSYSKLQISVIPQDLLPFAGELVCQNVDFALSRQDPDLRNTLSGYNKLIRQFLAVLPEEDELAKRLFDRYQINDPVPYVTMEEASGYHPLYDILTDKGVPMKWKELADKQMCIQALAELDGRAKPRAEQEAALPCFANHIQMANYGGKEGYARELFASQIRFITDLASMKGYERRLFNPWQVIHILEVLGGRDLAETRHKFARLVVLQKSGGSFGFSITDRDSQRAAEQMLLEFGEKDSELSERLKTLTTEAMVREAATAAHERNERQKARKVLVQMK